MARNKTTKRQRQKVFRRQKRKSEKKRRKTRNHRRNTRKSNSSRSSKKSNSSRSNRSYRDRFDLGTRVRQESIHSDDSEGTVEIKLTRQGL